MNALSFLSSYSNEALLALRLAIGIIFLVHGPKKLGNIASFMGCIGIAETLGALAMIFGFLTAWAALGLGIIMLGAMYKKIAEWKVPFTAMDKTGWEFDFMILAGCIALMILGAGTLSVDSIMLGI